MTDNEIVLGLSTIVVLGVGAQWIGRRFEFPSLLLLLPAGLLAGGVLGIVEPEELFGDTLFPLVTLLVALLLFHAGLGLRLRDLPSGTRSPVIRLVTIGAAVTFLGSSLTVLVAVGVDTDIAFLIGAILVVSGPTVVGPLLDVLRAAEPGNSILTWESTVLDPVGATLGVVVLNLILASDRGGIHPVLQALGRLGVGVAIGLVAAAALVFVISRFLVTDNMEAAVAVLFAVAAFGAAELVFSEAGLFATVTLGVVAANQRVAPTARITGFGETLEVLIIGILFILLGALIDIDSLLEVVLPTAAIVVVLILVVRPLAAAVALARTAVPVRQRVLIGGIDPRGIVAAATAAQFSGTLGAAGIDAEPVLPIVFGVILGTGAVYGLTAGTLADRLGVRRSRDRGVAFVGDAGWLVEIARALADLDVPVLVISPDPVPRRSLSHGRVGDAATEGGRVDGLPTMSLLDEETQVRGALREIGPSHAVVAIRPGTAETLVDALLVELLGRRHVLRVPEVEDATILHRLDLVRGNQPFQVGLDRSDIEARVAAGARVEVLSEAVGPAALPLVAVRPDGSVNLKPDRRRPGPDDVVVALVGP